MQFAGRPNEYPSEFGKDTPVARFVGVQQRVARDAAVKTHVIQVRLLQAQTGFDVAQTFAPSELREAETEKLIRKGETLDVVIASVALDTPAKLDSGRKSITCAKIVRPDFMCHPFSTSGMALT